MSTLVMKFGGSSVGTTTALTQVLGIVLQEHERWDRMLLVVSALEGVTDALIEAASLARMNNRRGYRRIVGTLRTRHLALIEYLPLGNTEREALQADIDRLLFDMLDTCQALSEETEDIQPYIDAIVGVGERLAARVVAVLLRQNNLRGVAIDATDLIVTDSVYGNATINLQETRERIATQLMPMLDRQIIPVITGFIGATSTGRPTTLGRGGSDYTASVLGVSTDADEVWVWSDVDGMMSADPREVSDAQVITHLAYDEIAELAYLGAYILHPRMIAPLKKQNIPVRVRNIFKLRQQGTLISHKTDDKLIKAVTSINGIVLEAKGGTALSNIASLVDNILFRTTGNHADVMIATQASYRSLVCFIVPTTAGHAATHTLKETIDGELNPAWTAKTVSVISIIGDQIGQLSRVTNALFERIEGIPVLAMVQGASPCSLSLVVEPDDRERALLLIHDLITQ